MTKLIINIIDGNKHEDVTTCSIDCKPFDIVGIFDDGCPGWSRDQRAVDMFLKYQEQYANDICRARGHLFLNEVYDMLGMPRRKIGQLVGWIYDAGKRVDFGLKSKVNDRFNRGEVSTAILEFNVDGEILSKI